MKNAASFLMGITLVFGALQGNEISPQKEEPGCKGSFFIQGDFLYWKAQITGLEIFTNTSRSTGLETEISPTESRSTFISRSRFFRPHFEARPGFRVGAGYNFENCDWALASYWTHLRGHGDMKHSGRVHLDYNVLDLLLTGLEFKLGSSFIWRPFAGARAAWIHQKIKTKSKSSSQFNRPSSDQNITLSNASFSLKNDIDFRGVGPEVGVHVAWNLPKMFRVYADAAGSLLFTHYKAKFVNRSNDTTTFLSTEDPTETQFFASKDRGTAAANTSQFVLDLGLGVSWQKYACLCNHAVGWIFKLGWEHSHWFNFNSLGNQGALYFDGLTASAQIQF